MQKKKQDQNVLHSSNDEDENENEGIESLIDLKLLAEKARQANIVLYAATEGNHGRAVAYMASLLGLQANIHIPADLDTSTQNLISQQGARLFEAQTYDQAVMQAANAAAATTKTGDGVGILVQDTAWEGYEAVPGWIVDGYGTMFLEVDGQLEEMGSGLRASHIVVPVGVGSLAHAVVRHYKSSHSSLLDPTSTSTSASPLNGLHSRTKVLTVEPSTAPCLSSNIQLHADSPTPTPIPTSHTICNGMNCGTVSSTAWIDLRNHVDAFLTVDDWEVHRGIGLLKGGEGLEVGPCSAAGLAALLRMREGERGGVGLGRDSVVVLLGTEGSRGYDEPMGEPIRVVG